MLLIVLSLAADAQTLTVDGACPGRVELSIADVTPSGAFALVGGQAALGAASGPGRILAWALPTSAPTPEQVEQAISQPGDLAHGERLYHKWCARCHGAGGMSASGVPDLRASLARVGPDAFEAIALEGLPGTGMPSMKAYVDDEQTDLIRRYLESRSEPPAR